MNCARVIILSVVLALSAHGLFGAAGDLKLSQKNASNSAWIDRLLADGTAGYMLTTNGGGTGFAWVAPATSGPLPSQTGKNGYILTTNGTAASWSSSLLVSTAGSLSSVQTTTSSVGYGAALFQVTTTPSAGYTSEQNAIDGRIYVAGTNYLGTPIGINGHCEITNANTQNGSDIACGINAETWIRGIGFAINASGFNVGQLWTDAGATATNLVGLGIAFSPGSFQNLGTATNTYGIYIGALTGGTQTNAPYAIYTAGTEAVRFGGQVTAGGSSTGAVHVISGTGTSAAYIDFSNTGGAPVIGQAGALANSVFGTSGTAYALSILAAGTRALALGTNATAWLTMNGTTGAITHLAPITITTTTNNVFSVGGTGTANCYQQFSNTGGLAYIGTQNSAGAGFGTNGLAYAAGFVTGNATALQLGTNNVLWQTIGATGLTAFHNTTAATAYSAASVTVAGGIGIAESATFKTITTPAAPSASNGRLYVDVSGGKNRLMVIFPSGAAQVVATEP